MCVLETGTKSVYSISSNRNPCVVSVGSFRPGSFSQFSGDGLFWPVFSALYFYLIFALKPSL